MLDKDIDHCLLVLKDCINDRQSAFDYELISTLEKCKGLEAENKALKDHIVVCVRESGEFYDQRPKDDQEALDIFKKAFEL